MNMNFFREIYIESGTKADDSETLSFSHGVSGLHLADDAPCNQAGYLNHTDLLAVLRLEKDGIVLVFLRCFIKIGREKFTRKITARLKLVKPMWSAQGLI